MQLRDVIFISFLSILLLEFVAAGCGDGTCESRWEDHFTCSQDCAGGYFVIDMNNPACTNNVAQSGAGSIGTPFCRLSVEVEANILPGDTYYFRGGVQNISYLPISHGGTEGNYVTFRNYPGERPILEQARPWSTTWNLVDATQNYRIFKSSLGWGTDTTEYPYHLILGMNNPLSPLFYYEDLHEQLVIPDTTVPFNAFYLNCSSGEVFARFSDTSFDPNSETAYLDWGERLIVKADYIRFIGLTFDHGYEGIKIALRESFPGESPPTVQTNHVELYDNTIRAGGSGVGDVLGSSSPDDFLIIQNNTFLNITRNVIVWKTTTNASAPTMPTDVRLIRCVSELENWRDQNDSGFSWFYKPNHLDRAVYGAGTGTIFSDNYVDMGGSPSAAYVSANSKYYNNYMTGYLDGRSETGGTLIYNNIIVTKHGGAIFMQSHHYNTTVMNNLLISDSSQGESKIVSFGGSDAAPTPRIVFKNNIVVDTSDEDDLGYCLYFYQTNKNNALLDVDNNLYLGCEGWSAFNTSGNYWFSTSNASANFDRWKIFLGAGRENLSILSDSVDGVFANFPAKDYRLNEGSLAQGYGSCESLTGTDMLGRLRDDGSCDIGPLEYFFEDAPCSGDDCGDSSGGNSGGGAGGGSGAGGIVSGSYSENESYKICVEVWTCENWDPCVDGIQTRTCTDLNICGTNVSQPLLEQLCSPSGAGSITGLSISELSPITAASMVLGAFIVISLIAIGVWYAYQMRVIRREKAMEYLGTVKRSSLINQ